MRVFKQRMLQSHLVRWFALFGLLAVLVCTGPLSHSSQQARAASSGGVKWDVSSVNAVYNPSAYFGGQYYSYAPTVINDGNTQHIWTCHNAVSGVIGDHIYYTKRVNGSVVSSQAVLTPDASGWDTLNNCDPTVVQTTVTYNGVQYGWVMFFLGNDCGGEHNQIGVAFAQSIDGPWVKYANNPIISSPAGCDYWGVGQPAATANNGTGKIELFYRLDDSAGFRLVHQELNLGDMSNPSFGAVNLLPTAGEDATGKPVGNFVNPDIVYDPSRDRFYAIGEQTPFNQSNPNYVGEAVYLFSMDGSSAYTGSGSWRLEGEISSALTGYPRNHNAGIERTSYGTLPDPGHISIMFATSCADEAEFSCNGGQPVYTYSLSEVTGALDTSYGSETRWSLDDGSGNIASDSSGNGDNGRLINAPGWTTGQYNGGLSLNGSSQYIGAGGSLVNTAGDFTVAAWVKLNSLNGFQTFVSQDGVNISGFYLQKTGDTNQFAFALPSSDSTGANITKATSSITLATGTWYHLAGVRSGNTIKLYVNGTLVNTQTSSGSWSAAGSSVAGRGLWNQNDSDFTNGTLDEVRFYQRALSDSEIATLYATNG